MAKKYEVGDIHAPVEEADASFSLKIAVVFLFIIAAAAIGVVLASFEVVRRLFGA